MPEQLKTDPSLLSALERASSRSLSREQMERQRISFIMGSLPSRREVTREEVQGVLERQAAGNQRQG